MVSKGVHRYAKLADAGFIRVARSYRKFRGVEVKRGKKQKYYIGSRSRSGSGSKSWSKSWSRSRSGSGSKSWSKSWSRSGSWSGSKSWSKSWKGII
jgi:hypothetical protein